MTTTNDSLQLGPDLAVPTDAVTRTIAVLAATGAGKSNGGAVLAEEFYAASLPFIAIDPKGDWWGLRSSGDGTGPGLPIPIFGGMHGDLPLHEGMGALIADVIVDQNLTCILDVSDFSSEAAQIRFLTEFGRRLFDLHKRAPQARHLILEEADEFLPQVVHQNMTRCVNIWTKIVKQGRQRGLGVTIISQRSAAVNKNALSQCQTLIPMRTTSAHDRKAILEWISYHEVGREVVDSLPALDDGAAWVISPQWLVRHGMPAVQSFRFRQRWTLDSGATPEVGQVRRVATLADIDLKALSGRMAAVVEQAEQDDPAKLRKRITELEREARAGKAQRGRMPDEEWRLAEVGKLKTQVADLQRQLAEAAEPERVEVPVLSPGDIAAFEQQIAALRGMADEIELALGRATRPAPERPRSPVPVPTPRRAALESRPVAPTPVAGTDPAAPGTAQAHPDTPVRLGKAHRAILAVLAQFPEGREKRPVAMLAGYSAKAGHFGNALSDLRRGALIEPGMPLKITEAGMDALGPSWEPPPAGAALIGYWMGQLGKAEREVFAALLEAYPDTLTKAQVAERTGYSATAGHFGNALSRLRTLELIRGIGDMKADDTLAQQSREAV